MGEKALSNGVDPSLGENKKILNSVAEHRELFTKYFYSGFGMIHFSYMEGMKLPVCN